MAIVRCAIYTRKSSEEGLSQTFNSLDAQREAAEAYILSQREQGWAAVPERYDDGGFTGGNMDRPALQRLLADIEGRRIDCVIVYKVDRLSRSLLDFARILDSFEKRQVSFVSVTQQFNTSMSLGRLTLNILLSFAHYAECGIMQSHRAEVAVWPAFQRRGTPHNPGSKNEVIGGVQRARRDWRAAVAGAGFRTVAFPHRAAKESVRRGWRCFPQWLQGAPGMAARLHVASLEARGEPAGCGRTLSRPALPGGVVALEMF